MLSVKRIILLLAWISAGALSTALAANDAAPPGGAEAAKSGKPAAASQPVSNAALKKGMTAQEVKERWGEPVSVEPFPTLPESPSSGPTASP